MTWIKIDRDENGYVTDDCLEKIEACYEKEIPVAIAYVSYGTDYDVITPSSDIQGWFANIHNTVKFTHYLPIPKLEL